MPRLFFSYSHRDEADRDELEIHLKPLQREGIIESWHDRRIDAGGECNQEISAHLEDAELILLLVSPYFLASDYCYENEMRWAMERHEAGTAKVIPVILNPCDWHSAPFGKLLAVPTDGRPISKFPNRHDGFLEVAKAIRKCLGVKAPSILALPATHGSTNQTSTRPRSSNLGIKKSFTDHDRDGYLEDAFSYVANFFEESLNELQRRNSEVTTKFRRLDDDRFAAYIYLNGKSVAQCSVRTGEFAGRSICFSTDPNSTNSWNEHVSVGENGTSLFLKSAGIMSSRRSEELTPEGAAEEFWSSLIRPLQR